MLLNKNNFFFNSKQFYQNLNKTKKIFNFFRLDLKNFKIPFLQTYDKKYGLDFSLAMVKKFSRYNNIIIVGMGGSILGAKSIYSFFKKKIKKKIFFFDNLDLNFNSEFKKIKNLKNSCFVVVSKSGNTLETITNLGTFFSKNLIKKKIIFITELKDNCLMDMASKFDAEVIEHKNFIGGRYSVLSEAGMFPAALMGLNIMKFRNLEKLINDKNFVSLLIRNVAGIYTLSTQGIKNSVILNYDSKLNDLCLWYQQLVGESLGKRGKGITPILSIGPKDHHSIMQLYLDGPRDKFFTFLSSSNKKDKQKVSEDMIPNSMSFLRNKKLNLIINAQCEATKNVFKSKNIFFRHFIFNKSSERELGSFFTFFVLETILLARLMKINPFDQPAVEQIKTETKKILLG